jgi:hypothetical protein
VAVVGLFGEILVKISAEMREMRNSCMYMYWNVTLYLINMYSYYVLIRKILMFKEIKMPTTLIWLFDIAYMYQIIILYLINMYN